MLSVDENPLIKTLYDFLKCHRDCHEKTNVVVHQFGFTILYLPVYLVLRDLETKGLNISYRVGYESDNKTHAGIIKNGKNFLSLDDGAYHLGLSEVAPRLREGEKAAGKAIKVFEKPFIKRVPLWGVSLANNPLINRVKVKKSKSKIMKMSYWRLFESKFSLLEPRDFSGFKISIYGETTTVYRLFKQRLGNIRLRPSFVTTSTEFDVLFSGSVDVALTVHPWNAVSRSEAEARHVEIVYNHIDKPAPFTSIYVAKIKTKIKNSTQNIRLNLQNEINDKVLEIFHELVRQKIEIIYRSNKNDLKRFAKAYCEVIKKATGQDEGEKCPVSKQLRGKSPTIKNCEDCLIPNQVALQVIADSRIYYFDMKDVNEGIKAQEMLAKIMEWEIQSVIQDPDNFSKKNFQKYFPYSWENQVKEKKESEREKIITDHYEKAMRVNDPIWYSADLWDQLKHHGKEKISKLDSEEGLIVNRLKGIAKICDPDWSYLNNSTLDGFRNDWKIGETKDWEEFLDLGPTVAGNPRFYFPRSILKKAFTEFVSQTLENHSNKIEIKKVEIGMLDGEKRERLIWVWICYECNGGSVAGGAFVKKNDIGKKILNGWWFKREENFSKLGRFFEREGHGEMKLEDGKWLLKWKGKKVSRKYNENENWVFTFRALMPRNEVKDMDG